MASFVITGANGFIGKRLTKALLDSGNRVFAIVTNRESMLDLTCQNLIIKEGFFPDYEHIFSTLPVSQIQTVFHVAWQGLCGKDLKDFETQLDDAKYACDAFLFSQIIKAKKFILISSINTAETITYLTGENHTTPRYTNIYGISKLAAEIIGKTIAANQIDSTWFLCAQLSMVYGEGNFSKMVPNVVMSSLLKGNSPSLIRGDKPYDLVYINDVINGLIAISEKGKNLETYPIGHNKLSTFKQLFSEIGRLIRPDVPMNFGQYPGDVEVDFSKIDFLKTKNDLGFEPTADFSESILSTANWIKNNLSCF